MITAKSLRDDFNERLAALQKRCKHTKTQWMDFQWAPGHFSGRVKVCLRCEKIIKEAKPLDWGGTQIKTFTTKTTPNSTTSFVYTN
jgi:hypothetical protein